MTTDITIRWASGEHSYGSAHSPVRIGRLKRSEIQIVSPEVSRLHLSIEWNGAKWEAHDYSANGTFMSGTRMAPRWIVDEPVKINLGDTGSADLLVEIIPPISASDDSDSSVLAARKVDQAKPRMLSGPRIGAIVCIGMLAILVIRWLG